MHESYALKILGGQFVSRTAGKKTEESLLVIIITNCALYVSPNKICRLTRNLSSRTCITVNRMYGKITSLKLERKFSLILVSTDVKTILISGQLQ